MTFSQGSPNCGDEDLGGVSSAKSPKHGCGRERRASLPAHPLQKNPAPLAGQSLNRFIYHQSLWERLISRVIPGERLLQGLPFILGEAPCEFHLYCWESAPTCSAAARPQLPQRWGHAHSPGCVPPCPCGHGAAAEHGAQLLLRLPGRSGSTGAGGRRLARAERLSFWRAWSQRQKIM